MVLIVRLKNNVPGGALFSGPGDVRTDNMLGRGHRYLSMLF